MCLFMYRVVSLRINLGDGLSAMNITKKRLSGRFFVVLINQIIKTRAGYQLLSREGKCPVFPFIYRGFVLLSASPV